MAQDMDRLDEVERQAAEALAAVQNLRRMRKGQADDAQFTITPTVKREIEGVLAKTSRYKNLNDFVDEAVKNMTEFWNHPENMMYLGSKLWPDFTDEMKQQIKKNAPVFYYSMEAGGQLMQVVNMKNQIPAAKAALSVEKFSASENLVGLNASRLMHQSYNRFFPLKILVTTLGLMIKKNKTEENEFGEARWIDYEKFRDESYGISLELSDKLRAMKSKKGDKRNMRISTGLPISHEVSFSVYTELLGQSIEKTEKDEKSKQRFFDCFVGLKESTVRRHLDDVTESSEKQDIFSGALNETGLVHLRNNNGKLEITLSEDGFEFFKFENPVIKNIIIIKDTNAKSPTFDKPTGIDFNRNADGVIEKIFSEDERKFIGNTIIPKFTLEKQIIDDIVTKIKKDGKVKAEVLDDVVEDSIIEWKKDNQDIAEKQKIDEKNKDVYRIATMGRLAEIGIVNWEIEEGISFYSINK